jgi:predicted MPP superfamily phosphohydrolase
MKKVFYIERYLRWLPDLIIVLLVLLLLYQLRNWAKDWASKRPSRLWRSLADVIPGFIAFWLLIALALRSSRVGDRVDTYWRSWIRAGGLTAGFLIAGLFLCALLWRRVPKFQPERRKLLLAAQTALFAAPAAVTGFGMFVQRREFQLKEVNFPIAGLPPDLQGLRLVQLSDIHLSPFLTERELAYVIGMANETKAHIALVTGDLISNHDDPLDACLLHLTKLRSDVGTLGCLGNHETYAGMEDYAASAGGRLGIHFLREEARALRFGKATLNIAGVDYQRYGRTYLSGTDRLILPGSTNILLSHNPDVFEVAAEQGWGGVISGHTHGGQVNVEILHQNLNVARFFTPFVYGLYRKPSSAIYVTRGIGTIGMPVRLGAPPEIALIKLCAT